MKESIYEYHIFELRKYELDGKKSIAVIDTASAVVKRNPEKENHCTISEFLRVEKLSFCFISALAVGEVSRDHNANMKQMVNWNCFLFLCTFRLLLQCFYFIFFYSELFTSPKEF